MVPVRLQTETLVWQDELIELFASMDKAKGGVETGIISHVRACALPLPTFHLC